MNEAPAKKTTLWNKITTKDQLNKLDTGNKLMKYPLFGPPCTKDEFYHFAPTQPCLFYEIRSIKTTKVNDCTDKEFGLHMQNSLVAISGLYSIDTLTSGVWWQLMQL